MNKGQGRENSIGKLVAGSMLQDIATYAIDRQGAAGVISDPELAESAGRFQALLLSSPSSRMWRGVPHLEQNPRATMADERKRLGCPRVHVRFSAGTETKAAPQEPKAFWHMRQWQIPAFPRGSLTRKRTAPHWHPPDK